MESAEMQSMNNCFNNQCSNKKEEGYDLCRDCIKKYLRICTCNKKFITEQPKHYVLGKKNSAIILYDLPNDIPEFFYSHLEGNIYHIPGCRGCQHTEEISVKDNFNAALRASIVLCVYQKDNDVYEYLSDALDPDFEKYAISQGITLGEPAEIAIGKPVEVPTSME